MCALFANRARKKGAFADASRERVATGATTQIQTAGAPIVLGDPARAHNREPELELPLEMREGLGGPERSSAPAAEVVRMLDDGSMRAIASVERIAALELARSMMQEGGASVQQQLRELHPPQKIASGYRPSAFIKKLLLDILQAAGLQLLLRRRVVGVRSARDSFRWLLEGITVLSAHAAALLERIELEAAEDAKRNDERSTEQEPNARPDPSRGSV